MDPYAATAYTGKYRLKMLCVSSDDEFSRDSYSFGDMRVTVESVPSGIGPSNAFELIDKGHDIRAIPQQIWKSKFFKEERTSSFFFDILPSNTYKISIFPRGKSFWRTEMDWSSHQPRVTAIPYRYYHMDRERSPNMVLYLR